MSTAYSIWQYTGSEAALDDTFAQARLFSVAYVVVSSAAAAVCLPGAPPIPILVRSQVLNAVLLLPCSSSCTAWHATGT